MLRNDRDNFSGLHSLTFPDEQLFNDARFWRTDFVLHFHRFDYDDALARFDFGIFCDQ